MNQQSLIPHYGNKNNDTVVVTALQSELPTLALEEILFTGVGKVNATHTLTRYLERNKHIRTVINYGTAGGVLDVNKGEIVECSTFVQGDMDLGPLTPGPGITLNDPKDVCAVLQFNRDGKIVRTQDQFISDLSGLEMFENLLDGKRFNLVDMEAYALAKVCKLMDRDFICYKYISDDADDGAEEQWEENVSGGEEQFYKILCEKHGYERL